MKIRVLLISVLVALAAGATAQTVKANEILGKVNWLDMCKWVLPIFPDKDKKQLNAMLTGLEKIRADEDKILKSEEKELLKLDKEITDALDAAVLRGELPKRELQVKVAALTETFYIRRRIFVGQSVDDMYAVCKTALNDGQMKAMSNIVNPAVLDPSAKRDKMTEEERIKLYIRAVVLDKTYYEILKLLFKQAK